MADKYRFTFGVLALLAYAAVSTPAQEQRVRMKNLPPAVQKAVQEQSKGARLRGLSKEVADGKTVYEAELLVNGHHKDVLLDAAGNVLEIEEQVTRAALPEPVKAALARAAGKNRVLMIESITTFGTNGGHLTAYEAHLRKAGKAVELKFAPDGKPL